MAHTCSIFIIVVLALLNSSSVLATYNISEFCYIFLLSMPGPAGAGVII